MEQAIVIQEVCKSYFDSSRDRPQETVALADVSFTVRPGELVTIFGPNGCGKTTLLNIVGGLDQPDRGVVRVPTGNGGVSRVGFVFQNYTVSLFPWRSVLANIGFPLELADVDRKDRDRRVRDMCDALGIKVDLAAYPYQLSGGQRQLVAIARALVSRPEIVLMDEPFSSLDYQNKIMIEQRLLDLWQESGVTILLVSHDIDEAIYLADRVVLLSRRPGRVLEVLETRLERPRRLEQMVESPRFLELKARALSVFRGEIGV